MKIKYIVFILSIVVSFSSCNFLDEYDPNATTTGNFYKSESDIQSTLAGVYGSLKQNYFFVNNHYFTDVRAHNTVVTDAGANSGIPYQFYNFTLTEENSYVYNRYAQIFKTISRANKLIAHLDDISYSDPSSRDTYEAQARFVRALSYYYLVTEFGDVPLALKELKSKDDVSANAVRKPKKDVYNAIFDDLKYVENSPLADQTASADCGKASKAAAYALCGKAYLQYACDEDFESEKSDVLKSAIEQLTQAWNLRTFNQLSDVSFANIWNLSTQKSCPENIFQINFIQKNADLGSSWNYLYGPVGSGVTSMKQGQGENMTTVDIYNKYDSKDVRRSFLKSTVKAGITYYHTMKYVDLDCGADGYGGNNWIVLRYADVALMLAEAYYWSNDEDQAKTYLNMVRKRAGLSDWDGTDLRQGIYDERQLEFIQEGLRWQDLLRMYSRMEMIEHFSTINSNFSMKDLLLPIPYNERILNTEGMYQNPGYGK